MKTYNTIDEAFLKGLGDVFFKKDNQFICLNRNRTDQHNELLQKGFTMLSYEETINTAKLQQKEQKEAHLKRAAEFGELLQNNNISDSEKRVMERLKHQREHLAKETAKKTFNYFPDYEQEFSDADPGL